MIFCTIIILYALYIYKHTLAENVLWRKTYLKPNIVHAHSHRVNETPPVFHHLPLAQPKQEKDMYSMCLSLLYCIETHSFFCLKQTIHPSKLQRNVLEAGRGSSKG